MHPEHFGFSSALLFLDLLVFQLCQEIHFLWNAVAFWVSYFWLPKRVVSPKQADLIQGDALCGEVTLTAQGRPFSP